MQTGSWKGICTADSTGCSHRGLFENRCETVNKPKLEMQDATPVAVFLKTDKIERELWCAPFCLIVHYNSSNRLP